MNLIITWPETVRNGFVFSIFSELQLFFLSMYAPLKYSLGHRSFWINVVFHNVGIFFPTKQLLPYSHFTYWINSLFLAYRILCCTSCTKMVFKLRRGQCQILSPFRNLTHVHLDTLHRFNAVNPWGYMLEWRLFHKLLKIKNDLILLV